MSRGRALRKVLLSLAGAYLIAVLLAAAFAPVIATHDPTAQDLVSAFEPSSAEHWLGTDGLGRDTFSRIVYGAQVAVLAAVEATGIAMLIGIPVGLIIGFRCGWLDRIVMRFIDGMSAIPSIVLAIALIASLGTGLTRSMAAVGFVLAMITTRLTRSQVLSERERDYVGGARVAGASETSILFRHILPNVAPVLIVQATLIFSTAITIEAGLSFLGLGVQPPMSSWGIMLSDANGVTDRDAFQAVPPGLAIFLSVLAINLWGDQLQALVVGGRRRSSGSQVDPPAVSTEQSDSEVAPEMDGAALVVESLSVDYQIGADETRAVDEVSFTVRPGEVVVIAGESGCGKSSLGLGIAGLLPSPAVVAASRLQALTGDGGSVLSGATNSREWRQQLAVVFQEPAASLNPLQTVGHQLARALRSHGCPSADAKARALELLEKVRIPHPERTMSRYPHQISGGMAQRVVIALGLAQNVSVLIADEPTTALDVTVQSDVLDLLRSLCAEFDLAVVLITHDLGVVADIADRIIVMYAGEFVEQGSVLDVMDAPRQPYTAALAKAVPRNEAGAGIPVTIQGSVPDLGAQIVGCRFAPRCPFVIDACRQAPIEIVELDHRQVRCIRQSEIELEGIPEGAVC